MVATDCGAISPMLIPYIMGELKPGQVKQVNDHLQSCQTCRNHLNLYKKIISDLRFRE